MDDNTRRRALAGALGLDAQRFALAKIAGESGPAPSALTSRQRIVAIIVAALLIGAAIALAALRLIAPARLAHHA